MKKNVFLTAFVLLVLFIHAGPALATNAEPPAETVIEPAFEVPESVRRVLETASHEIGYTEGEHGWSKYGEWAGDPYAQWCAEFLCWCVDRTDREYGTSYLNSIWPLYSGSNTGKNWFINAGRYIVRWGNLDGWGYQWLKGSHQFLTTGDYIPQPGDWVFFTWDSDQDTDHVAMVEYCALDTEGLVHIHVIEGNKPSSVQRFSYPIDYNRILGYGTVHEAASTTLRYGNIGQNVKELQRKLCYLGFLPEEKVTGTFGSKTKEAVSLFQAEQKLKVNGIANLNTQYALDEAVDERKMTDPAVWLVEEDE